MVDTHEFIVQIQYTVLAWVLGVATRSLSFLSHTSHPKIKTKNSGPDYRIHQQERRRSNEDGHQHRPDATLALVLCCDTAGSTAASLPSDTSRVKLDAFFDCLPDGCKAGTKPKSLTVSAHPTWVRLRPPRIHSHVVPPECGMCTHVAPVSDAELLPHQRLSEALRWVDLHD